MCFHLREGYKFHFLVSHPPCGDACIAPPAEGGAGSRAESACQIHSTASPNPESSEGPAAIVPASGTGAKRLVPSTDLTQNAGAEGQPVRRCACLAVKCRGHDVVADDFRILPWAECLLCGAARTCTCLPASLCANTPFFTDGMARRELQAAVQNSTGSANAAAGRRGGRLAGARPAEAQAWSGHPNPIDELQRQACKVATVWLARYATASGLQATAGTARDSALHAGALLSHFLARPLRFHAVICGYEGLAHPQQSASVCASSEPGHAQFEAQRAALRRAVQGRCEGSWNEICGDDSSACDLQQARVWLQTWKRDEPQVI